jgi:TonB-dependent starch-binding outer membrane protein SusC
MCQPITITGKVINEERQPVPGATITIKGTNKKTIANTNGEFTIHDAKFTDTLIITAIGYETDTYSIDHSPLTINRPFTIMLKRKIVSLGEVIISTGYQEIAKERATGAFEKIDPALISRNTSSNILERLEGVSSIYFDRRNGSVNPVTIRGRSTIFGNAGPLIVVDNIPYDGDINHLDPNDIESVTILKDAAAASIWGVRAGNGVIVLTTKKGSFNKKPSLEISSNIIIGEEPNLFYAPAMTSADFIDMETMLFNKGLYNADINNTTNRPPLTPVVELLLKRRNGLITAQDSASAMGNMKTHDLRNDYARYFYRSSFTQQYMLTSSGGASRITYRISAGLTKNLSDNIRSSSQRVNLRSQTLFIPVKQLEINTIISYTGFKTTPGGMSNISITGSRTAYPYAQLANDAGDHLVVIKDYRLSYIDTAGAGKLLDWKYRPLDELDFADNGSRSNELRLNTSIKYTFIKDLSAELRYQFEKQSVTRENYYSQQTYFARNLINKFYNPNATNKYGIPLGGILDEYSSDLISHSARAQLNYKRTWNAIHDIVLLAGTEIRELQTSSYTFRTYGYDDDRLTYGAVNWSATLPVYNNLGNAQLIPNPASFDEGTLRFVSLFANGSYTYKSKYILSASIRKDASNIFGVNANRKWIPLWSAGLAWKPSGQLKLRAAYGYNGNTDNSLSAFTTITYFSSAMFTSLPYARVNNPPNPELRWERQSVLNIGADFNTKNKRIEGSLDLYIKNGKDLIGNSPVEQTTGVQSPQLTFTYRGNVAAMRGKGLELQLTTINITRPLTWRTILLFNYATAKVTKYYRTDLNASAYLNAGLSINPVIGKPLYTIYSYQWAGLDPATGDPLGLIDKQPSKDYTALLNVTVDNLDYHGSAIPAVFGSLRNEWEYKNFALSCNIMYKLGYYFRRSSINYNSLLANWVTHSDYEKRWQKTGDELSTSVPSFIYPNPSVNRDNFYSSSSVLVEKGDHIRLQDIAVSYTFKKPQLKIYAYINNIGIIWKANRSGLDPDYPAGGFPLPATYSFGFKTTF